MKIANIVSTSNKPDPETTVTLEVMVTGEYIDVCNGKDEVSLWLHENIQDQWRFYTDDCIFYGNWWSFLKWNIISISRDIDGNTTLTIKFTDKNDAVRCKMRFG